MTVACVSVSSDSQDTMPKPPAASSTGTRTARTSPRVPITGGCDQRSKLLSASTGSCSDMGSAKGGERLVERLRRPHHGLGLGVVETVVAPDVGRVALDAVELGDDRVLGSGQRLGERGEGLRQLGVRRLLRQLLGPVERQVEVRAAV